MSHGCRLSSALAVVLRLGTSGDAIRGADWEYITDVPGKLLFGAFVLLATLKSPPRYIEPTLSFVCDRGPGPLPGLTVQSNCRFVSSGHGQVFDYTFWDYGCDLAVSVAQDCLFGFAGLGLGIVLANFVRARSGRANS